LLKKIAQYFQINCSCVREFIDYIAFATIDFWYKRDNKNKEKSLV